MANRYANGSGVSGLLADKGRMLNGAGRVAVGGLMVGLGGALIKFSVTAGGAASVLSGGAATPLVALGVLAGAGLIVGGLKKLVLVLEK